MKILMAVLMAALTVTQLQAQDYHWPNAQVVVPEHYWHAFGAVTPPESTEPQASTTPAIVDEPWPEGQPDRREAQPGEVDAYLTESPDHGTMVWVFQKKRFVFVAEHLLREDSGVEGDPKQLRELARRLLNQAREMEVRGGSER